MPSLSPIATSFHHENFHLRSMPLFGSYQRYQKQLTAFASLILTDVFPSSQYLYCDDIASSIFHSMISSFQSMLTFLSESMEEEFLCLSIWQDLSWFEQDRYPISTWTNDEESLRAFELYRPVSKMVSLPFQGRSHSHLGFLVGTRGRWSCERELWFSMNLCMYWWFVWNRLQRFSNRWSPDSSRSSKLGFWRRSLVFATRFVRFVQGLACDLVMSENSLQSTCYKVRPVLSRFSTDVSGWSCWLNAFQYDVWTVYNILWIHFRLHLADPFLHY